jgi:hypothetical protein
MDMDIDMEMRLRRDGDGDIEKLPCKEEEMVKPGASLCKCLYIF